MQPCRRFAVAAVLLLCSIASASAAGTGPFLVASDDLVLTGAQEHLLWQRLVARNAALRIDSCNRCNAPRLGRAPRAACNRHPADTGDETLQVCDAGQDAADR